MNHNQLLDSSKKVVSEYPVCQFYIVLGEHPKEFRNTKKSRYFPIHGNEDLELIQYAIRSEYKKKRKDGYAVAGEIIFLIPSLEYHDMAIDLMEKLNFKGSIKVIAEEKKEVVSKEAPLKEEVVSPVISDTSSEDVLEKMLKDDFPDDVPSEEKRDDDIKKILDSNASDNVVSLDNKKVDIEQPKVFHGDFPKKKENVESLADSIWDDDEKKNLAKGKKKVKSVSRKKKFKIDLPIVILIVSFLFLVSAIVLLFILK